MLRDRASLIVASMSAVMWVGICWVLGGLGPFTWIGAVLLLVGGVWAHVGRDDPPATDEPDDASQTPMAKKGRKRRSIYGPPS
jgi:hypothetical protein